MATKRKEMRNIILEVSYSDAVMSSAMTIDGSDAPPLASDAVTTVPGVAIDPDFGAVELPTMIEPFEEDVPREFSPFDLNLGASIDEDHQHSTFLVRAQCGDAELEKLVKSCANGGQVQGVYADPEIQVCDFDPNLDDEGPASAAPPRICPGSPPLGTDRHVAARIGVPWLRRRRMNGAGTYMAIVDTGINLAHLRSRGRNPILDVSRSWMARPGDVAGRLPVGHGTMVAYDTMIAAPRATLLDIALLRSTRSGGSVMAGLLSDAIRAYVHLYRIIRGPHRPGAPRSLVVNNSWGMFHESWDFPRNHPGRYMDNNRHPFNRIVGVLSHAGADILFAAGNCGRECPDGRCRGATRSGIYGANSHPQALSVAGVDVLKRRVGYSTSGPGRLMFMKPDLCGYTHFRGSGVYAADGGTSAACPVVAGVVGALRSRFPYNPADYRTSPAAIRNLLTRTAEDRGNVGFDFDYGWGIINGRRLALLRSLSVMQASDEAATSIDEVADVEALLDNIEGLEEVPETQDDTWAASDAVAPATVLEDQVETVQAEAPWSEPEETTETVPRKGAATTKERKSRKRTAAHA
ncbi:MAG: S8 family serine peptidase [Halieaceae bacterium]|nr:S8 family serine peptidase [Halieaceae bacterium]